MTLSEALNYLTGPTALLVACLLAIIGRWRGWWIDGPSYTNLAKDCTALEKENRQLTAMIIGVGRSADGVQDMQTQLARMLRGD